jgi:hypothetical protein
MACSIFTRLNYTGTDDDLPDLCLCRPADRLPTEFTAIGRTLYAARVRLVAVAARLHRVPGMAQTALNAVPAAIETQALVARAHETGKETRCREAIPHA